MTIRQTQNAHDNTQTDKTHTTIRETDETHTTIRETDKTHTTILKQKKYT